MPPAAHHGHRHRHRRVQKVTHIEHQGVQDVTSIYEIVPPLQSMSAAVPAMSSCSASISGDLSLSPPPHDSTLRATTTSSSIRPSSTHTEQLTTSNYPHPSAPGFLYPQPIVPPHVREQAMQSSSEDYQTSSRHHPLAPREHHQISTSLIATLVFLLIAVAGTWAFVVMLIHWRGATTAMQPAHLPKAGEEREERTGWFSLIRLRLNPRASTGRYDALRDVDEHELAATADTQALTSAHDLRKHDASPANPFLVAPDQPPNRRVKPRSSAEWAQEHRAYFLSPSGSRSPAAHSSGHGSPYSLSSAELEDVEAETREAQGRRASLARGDTIVAAGRNARTSWVDLGLAAVDGFVDRLARKIVRYADDGGKDEALLLPLAKSKQD